MPTSRYGDHTPWACSTSLRRAASGEPGCTLLRFSPITLTTAARTASAWLASPRACSSITRSSIEATKVTPAALMACKSHGASSHGNVGSRARPFELASTSEVAASRGSEGAAWRTTWATLGNSSNWLDVAATRERSSTLVESTSTNTGPVPSTQTRPMSKASGASSGNAVTRLR